MRFQGRCDAEAHIIATLNKNRRRRSSFSVNTSISDTLPAVSYVTFSDASLNAHILNGTESRLSPLNSPAEGKGQARKTGDSADSDTLASTKRFANDTAVRVPTMHCKPDPCDHAPVADVTAKARHQASTLTRMNVPNLPELFTFLNSDS